MDKEQEKRLQAFLDKAKLIAEQAKREAEQAKREYEIEHEKFLREHEETQKELAWWDSVKHLPLKERVEAIMKHDRTEEPQHQGRIIQSYFLLGEA